MYLKAMNQAKFTWTSDHRLFTFQNDTAYFRSQTFRKYKFKLALNASDYSPIYRLVFGCGKTTICQRSQIRKLTIFTVTKPLEYIF